MGIAQQVGAQGAPIRVETLSPLPEPHEHILGHLVGEGVASEEPSGQSVHGAVYGRGVGLRGFAEWSGRNRPG